MEEFLTPKTLKEFREYLWKKAEISVIDEAIIYKAWYKHCDKKLFKRLKEEWNRVMVETQKWLLEKYGFTEQDFAKLRFDLIFEDILLYTNFLTRLETTVRIYPKGGTMGWILNLETGEVNSLEGSNEPIQVDIEFRSKLENTKEWVVLWGMYSSEFVKYWLKNGIPTNTYFVPERWIVEHYWNLEKKGVMVNVKILTKYLVKVDLTTYMTIDVVPVSDFYIVEVT